MRELTSNEIFEVGGGVNFTTPVTVSLLNNVANATTVGKLVSLSFGVGYAIGSYLNDKFNISGRIVNKILD